MNTSMYNQEIISQESGLTQSDAKEFQKAMKATPVPKRIRLPVSDEKEPIKGSCSDKTVLIQRGPTGAGKSYHAVQHGAKRLSDPANKGITVVSADDYFEKEGGYNMKEIRNAHQQCIRQFTQAVARGDKLVIVSNTNVKVCDFIVYLKVAHLFDYNVVIEHIDSFNIELYKMKPKQAWEVLSENLKQTTRGTSWQGLPLEKVFYRHIEGIFANPHPYKECSSLEEALGEPLKVTCERGFYSLKGNPITDLKKSGIRNLMKNGIPVEWIENCLARDRGSSHITCLYFGWNPLSDMARSIFEKLEVFPRDLKAWGIGKAVKGEDVAYFVVVQCDKVQDALKKAGLPPKDLHLTLAFKKKDVHGVPKDKTTIKDGVESR